MCFFMTSNIHERTAKNALAWLARRRVIKAAEGRRPVTVILLPNAELRKLKKAHLKKDVAIVDVLSFPAAGGFPHPDSPLPPLGEIYLNRDIAAREPSRAKALVIHGLLHLLGYRHHRNRDRIEMEKLEKRVQNGIA
jgi:probable rRNA maturation factor